MDGRGGGENVSETAVDEAAVLDLPCWPEGIRPVRGVGKSLLVLELKQSAERKHGRIIIPSVEVGGKTWTYGGSQDGGTGPAMGSGL